MDLCRIWPFSFKIFAVMLGPTSMHDHRSTQVEMDMQIHCCFVSSITHSNNSNSQNWLMLDIYPHLACICNVQCLIWYRIQVLCDKSLFDALEMIIFLLEPFFRSFISLSATFNHGANDSACLKWHDASLSFMLNSPLITSLELSHIVAGSTPSHWKRSKNLHMLITFLWHSIGNQVITVHTMWKPSVPWLMIISPEMPWWG